MHASLAFKRVDAFAFDPAYSVRREQDAGGNQRRVYWEAGDVLRLA